MPRKHKKLPLQIANRLVVPDSVMHTKFRGMGDAVDPVTKKGYKLTEEGWKQVSWSMECSPSWDVIKGILYAISEGYYTCVKHIKSNSKPTTAR